MKTKLIIQESVAQLIIEAETNFEREMLKQVEMFSDHRLSVMTEQNWNRTNKGTITVTFDTAK